MTQTERGENSEIEKYHNAVETVINYSLFRQ